MRATELLISPGVLCGLFNDIESFLRGEGWKTHTRTHAYAPVNSKELSLLPLSTRIGQIENVEKATSASPHWPDLR